MPPFQANSYFFLQGAHCFVSFFIINTEQIIVGVSDRQQSYEEVLQKQ